MNTLELFLSILILITPVFLMILFGAGLKKLNFFSNGFYKELNAFIFRIALPALIFYKVSQAEVYHLFSSAMPVIAIGSTFITFLAVWLYAHFTTPLKDIAAFIQGCYRGNIAIVSLTLSEQIFGPEGLIICSITIGLLIPVYNVLAIFVLEKYSKSQLSIKTLLLDVIQSPLTIASLLGFAFSLFQIPVPSSILVMIKQLAAICLPLALIAIGARMLQADEKLNLDSSTLMACVFKLILIPAAFLGIGIAFNLAPLDIGILFLLSAVPTSIAGYVMTEAYGANAQLMGKIVMVSTLLSAFTLSLWLTGLVHFDILPTSILR